MHIALGVNNSVTFPIKSFLGVGAASTRVVATEAYPPHFGAATLTFDGNPGRRGGEWRINDQAHHRHPAWTPEQGFPSKYDRRNRPIVVVALVNGKYHARLVLESDLPRLPMALATALKDNKGIKALDPGWLPALSLPHAATTILESYKAAAEEVEAAKSDEYAPASSEDARKRALAEVVRRQGQQSFRKKLLKAYKGMCAITGTSVTVTLEGAHITPYLGPKTNHISNGILLRADIHTLFDLGLMSIDPVKLTVCVSSLLAGSEYVALQGKAILLPDVAGDHPSGKALEQHHAEFQL